MYCPESSFFIACATVPLIPVSSILFIFLSAQAGSGQPPHSWLIFNKKTVYGGCCKTSRGFAPDLLEPHIVRPAF